MGFWDDTVGLSKVGDWIDDGFDYLEDTVTGFFDDPLGTFGDVIVDTLKANFGINIIKAAMPDVPGFNSVYQDRKHTIRDTIAPFEVVYGRVRKGGIVRYIESSGTHDEYLHMAIVLASHQVESIDEVYFGDKLAATFEQKHSGDVQTFVIEPDYENDVLMSAQLGGHFVADPYVTNNTPENWTENHIMAGHCYLYVRLKYDKELFRRGIPTISVVMKGKRNIYDPRTDTYIYTDNHALCCLDYMRLSWGMNLDNSDIVMSTFEDGANFCDEMIATVGEEPNEPRFTCNGVIKIDRRPLDHLTEMIKAGGAFIGRTQGLWSYIKADYQGPVLSLDESDLAGELQLVPESAKSGRINTVEGVYISELDGWEPVQYPAVDFSAYRVKDGEILTHNLDYNFVTSPYQAQRLGQLAVERSRYGMTINGIFKFKALQLKIGDRISLNIAALGISNSVFQVMDLEHDYSAGVSLMLRQDSPDIYSDDPDARKAVTAPPVVNLPNPDPIAPTNINVTEELYSTNGGKDIKARALISWDEPEGRTQNYDIQMRPNGAQSWWPVSDGTEGTETRYNDVAPGLYDFRIRAINGIGWSSGWAYLNAFNFLGKTAPPPDVESLFISGDVLDWSYPSAPLDLAGFLIRAHQGDRRTWVDAAPLHEGLVTASRFDVKGLASSSTTFLLKAVDTSGTESENPTVVVTGVGAAEINNVIYTEDYKLNNWPGTITGAFVNGSNQIEANQVGGFYNPDPNSIFYDQDSSAQFYNDEYEKLEYEFTFNVTAQDAGVQLSLEADFVGNDPQFCYIPPGGSSYTPFSGVIPNVLEGTYQLKVIIPSQFGGTSPKLSGLLLNLDVPDITERLEDIAISSSGTRLPITKNYRGIGFVSLTMQTDGSSVASLKVNDKNHTLGPLVYAYNSSGTAVNTTIDAFIRGY